MIELDIDAYIPQKYIEDEIQKLEIYKKIAVIQTQKDYYDVQEEIEDRYGDLPESVQNLLEIALIKWEANELKITSISEKNSNVTITFKEDAPIDATKIPDLLAQYRNKLTFAADKNPILYIV